MTVNGILINEMTRNYNISSSGRLKGKNCWGGGNNNESNIEKGDSVRNTGKRKTRRELYHDMVGPI